MSRPSSAPLWLTELPSGVQYHILSFLYDRPRHPPIPITLQSAERLTIPLPKDLLPVSAAARTLAAVTADLLGPRAAYLTANVAKKELPKWITALGHAVKAVSTWDLVLECIDTQPQHYFNQEFYDELSTNALDMFRALSSVTIRLEVLDLRYVPFHRCEGMEDDVFQGFVQVLENSSASLKQLALPVSKLGGNALEIVSLKKLEVLTLEFRKGGKYHMDRASAMTFMRMLQAVDGHASRSQKMNTLRELRLNNMYQALCKYVVDSGCSSPLFATVRTLRMDIVSGADHTYCVDAVFIGLFPNLECLYWNCVPTRADLDFVTGACANLQELHLCPSNWCISTGITRVLAPVNCSDLEWICQTSAGKLKTLVVFGPPQLQDMRGLGETSPVLECLDIYIEPDNVSGLGELLGRHCRQIRGLRLTLSDSIEDHGWQALTQAVQGSSDTLCEIFVQAPRYRYQAISRDFECAVRSMIAILEYLGKRAQKVGFHMPMHTPTRSVIADAVCDILRTCTSHARGLEYLEAVFHMKDINDNIDSDKQRSFETLLKEKERMLEALPHLYYLKLGDLDTYAQEVIDGKVRMGALLIDG